MHFTKFVVPASAALVCFVAGAQRKRYLALLVPR